MPKIDIDRAPMTEGSGYPPPFHEMARGRVKRALGDAAGLTDFGVNLVRLPPGAWSSQRHWHSQEDEFVFVVSGELTLVTDRARVKLGAGECAAFAKGVADGHHFINEGVETAVYLEAGSRRPEDVCTYPDVDLHFDPAVGWYTRKNGEPYQKR